MIDDAALASNPLPLSVITICLNDPNIKDTCRSIAEQTFKNFEWIVIDGGSDETTLDILNEYRNHMSFFVSEKDNGRYHAMNKGIMQAKGEYLLFLNAGDYLFQNDTLKNIFAPQIPSHYPFKESHIPVKQIVYGEVIAKETGMFPYPSWSCGPHDLNLEFFSKYSLPHQATFIKRELFTMFGLYNEDYNSAGDYEFFMRAIISHEASFQYIPIVVSVYNFSGISSNITSESRWKIDQEQTKTYELYLDEQLEKFTKNNNEGYAVEKKISQLQTENEMLKESAQCKEHELAAIKNSTSWHITLWIRCPALLLRCIFSRENRLRYKSEFLCEIDNSRPSIFSIPWKCLLISTRLLSFDKDKRSIAIKQISNLFHK